MVDFLNNDITFQGDVTTEGGLTTNGPTTIGPGGVRAGEPAPGVSWPVHSRVQVANVTERNALVAWRAIHDPITLARPCLVWRGDGSLTGVEEISVDGTNWYAESALAGDIEMTLATTAPYGWILMQGQLLGSAATAYPALWAAADPALRSGSSLRIPDMRGRAPMGAGQGTGLTLRNMGDLVGDEAVGLSVPNLPPHSHTGTTNGADRSLNHQHYMHFGHLKGQDLSGVAYDYETAQGAPSLIRHDTSYVSNVYGGAADANLNHLHTFTTANTGSGTAHPNVQPSAVVNFKVKV